MSATSRLDAELAAIDTERADASAAYRAASKTLGEINKRREGIVTRKVDALTDEAILADEDTRRWLCGEVNINGAAGKRVRALMHRYGGQFYDNSWDGRDEYAGQWLPVPNLMMLRGADVTETASAIREIAKVWLLGRDTLPLDVFERTCSEHGSYGGSYDPATDTAILRVRRWGHDTELVDGPLEDVLRFIARNHYYRDPARENEHGDRINDDEEEW